MARLLLLVLLCALAPDGWVAEIQAQGRPITVEQLKQVYASTEPSLGWGELEVAEFVAASYGTRATAALSAILAAPASKDNYSVQVTALTTAQYGRVQVPSTLIIEFAFNGKGSAVGGVLRGRALRALSMRPEPELAQLWRRLFREEPRPSYRQHAPSGLACAQGTAALGELEAMRGEADSIVAWIVEFYLSELTKGELALACGGRATREQANDFPRDMPPSLLERGLPILQRIP